MHSKRSPLVTAILILIAIPVAGQSGPPVTVGTLAANLDGSVGGVAVDALGFVYVADFGEKVWKIDPWGRIEILTDVMYGASGNAIDGSGNLLQSNFRGNSIARISRDGSVTTFATGLNGPVGVAVGPDGIVYACNCLGNSISRIDPAGKVTELASGDLFNCPNGITTDSGGNVYAVNFSDGRMLKITPSGESSVLAIIPGGGNGHVAFAQPDFYVTGFRANRIYRVTPEGVVTALAGSGEFAEKDGVGLETALSTPNGIAYNPNLDRLYTNTYLTPWPARFARTERPVSSVRSITFPGLKERVDGAFGAGGAEAVRGAVIEYRQGRPGKVNELTMNLLGYEYLRGGEVEQAVAIFELGTEFFPKSFNAWDSLAEAYLTRGERERAAELYRKSLELNPSNANATAKLKELESALSP